MHLGFTGTQTGMSSKQKQELALLLEHFRDEDAIDEELTIFHHGDCIGADEEAHKIAVLLGLIIVVHPPINSSKRAFCEEGTLKEPLPYLERNRAIVNECEVLFAAPKSDIEVLRSGTWSTYRYAKKLKKQVYLLER